MGNVSSTVEGVREDDGLLEPPAKRLKNCEEGVKNVEGNADAAAINDEDDTVEENYAAASNNNEDSDDDIEEEVDVETKEDY